MDNLCHTLVGAAIGEAGLKKRAPYGNVVLMVAANLPDIDVFGFVSSTPAVAIRRGWTHGVLSQALLPVILTGLVLWIQRRNLSGTTTGFRARAAPLLLLSYVGVLTHVGLDWLNNYGVRLLMPFSNRWFYGDSVFIVDVWLWAALGAGVFIARRHARPSAAQTALAAATLYIAVMAWLAFDARERVLDAWSTEHGRPPNALMVGPVFANPLRRAVIVDAGDRYHTGTFSSRAQRMTYDPEVVPRGEDHPAVARAREHSDIRAVLIWARFPYFEFRRVDPSGWQVTVRDMRFGSRVGQVSVVVSDP